jgi:hypothetical protein
MKNFNLHRLLLAGVFLILPGFITAQENVTDQACLELQESIRENYQNQLSNYGLIPINDNGLRADYIILDQRDNLITRGWKDDVMVKYFVEISDFLIEIDNTRYFRLSYENDVMLNQRLKIK